MKTLKDFIEENREAFEQDLPDPEHELRFHTKLRDYSNYREFNRYAAIGRWFKIAAAILILVSFSMAAWVIFLKPPVNINHTSASMDEIQEIEHYYASLSEEKLRKISSLAVSNPENKELSAMVAGHVEELKHEAELLKQEYTSSGRNERLLDAFRNSYKVINGLLDHVLEQMNEEQKSAINSQVFIKRNQCYETIYT